MADDSRGDPPVVPTAIDLHEPKFPYPNGNTSAGTQSTSLEPSPPDSGTPAIVAQNMNSTPPLSRCSSETLPPTRPTMQKSATERPQPTAKKSWLGRRRAGTAGKPPRLDRRATLIFDPYSSESSSSEEDEPLAPVQEDKDAETEAPRPKHRKRREHSPGPFSRFRIANEHFNTKGRVSKVDGRLKLSINETVNSGYFAKTLGAGLRKHFKGADDLRPADGSIEEEEEATEKISPEQDDQEDPDRRVKLNIVVIVIGSRGDIQPFLKIGKILKEDYGHRVRIATHPAFKEFVEKDSGLDFFSIGGDPSELMAFMVKNPGLIPNMETVKDGEIGKRRAAMYDMFQGMWRACVDSTDDGNDHANLKMMGDKNPFVADAIIANPPSFAPPHIAERLGVPLHMMFTFPYTPTVQFPHPLANIKAGNVDAKYTNFMSYPLVEMMTWQGLGDLINRFRAKTLRLEEVSTLWAPGQLYRLKVPYTYLWSPGLVPKPKDWGPEIDIAGFVFLDLASSFQPPDGLVKFLEAGPPPVYIGFGSIVVDDPDSFTKLIFKAVEMAGVRALVSKGWGGFGSNEDAPDNVFMLENTPHDWLFPRVSAVVHHGGAGTTAIGLKCGKPTMIVPFFGDQPFWGSMVSKARAGAHECIPYKKLNAERLAEGIKQCLTDEANKNAQKIAQSIEKEGDGALNAVRSFHRSLPLKEGGSMRCSLLPNYAAAWRLKNTSLRLSPLAAELLVEWRKIKWNELRLLRHYEWNDFGGPGEPVTGGWGAIMGTMSDVATGVGLVPVKMAKSVKQREKYYEKKYRIKKRQQHKEKTLARANADLPNGGKRTPKNGTANVAQSPNNQLRPASRVSSNLSHLSVPEEYLASELAHEAGHGVKKTLTSILKSPMEFTLAVTQGFHNAPRLYGDETVRRPHRITGFHSGLRAGRDEFIYGVRDGVTGLWMQPYRGAKHGGVLGGLRGFGMGIGGLVLKDIAAFLGPPAYFMKGCDEQSMRKYQPTGFLRRARIIQGQKEVKELEAPSPSAQNESEEEEQRSNQQVKKREVEIEISRKWESVQPQLRQERRQNRDGIRGALLGKSREKGGTSVPRKPTSRADILDTDANPPPTDTQARPKKATSAPISQAELFKEMDGNVDGPGPNAIPRAGTGPMTATQWKEKGAQKRKHKFSAPPKPEKEETKEQAAPKHNVPNVFQASMRVRSV